MPVLETIIGVVTAGTVKTVTKFLYEKVEDYIRNKFDSKPPDEIEQLKAEINALKTQVESKENDDIPETVVEKVKAVVTQIEQDQSPLPAAEITRAVFQKWSESDELSIEDQTMLLLRELEVFIENAKEADISSERRFQLQDISASVKMNLEALKMAKFNARLGGLAQDEQAAYSAERQLRRNLFQARDFLR